MKQYTELASWWPLLSPPVDYADEASFFMKLLTERDFGPASTLLELGCGGGNNARYLKAAFDEVTLSDLSDAMLNVSRKLNPECVHVLGDMRTLRLDKAFDVVFVHDAIDFMTTVEDLSAAITTAFVHCKPGGAALFVPDHVSETFAEATEHGGSAEGQRAMRFLEWSYDPDPDDCKYVVEYVYLLRDGDAPLRVEHERVECGLFARQTWLDLTREAGFAPEIVNDPFERELFLGTRRSA